MKKQFIILTFFIAFACTSNAQGTTTVNLSLGRPADPPMGCAKGIGSCFTSVNQSLKGATLEGTNIGTAYFDASNRMTLSISKINLDDEFEKDRFKGKEFYLLTEDTRIGEGINPNEDRNSEGTILLKGWYPIIETEDHYFISFTLKK